MKKKMIKMDFEYSYYFLCGVANETKEMRLVHMERWSFWKY
jgi:hypothetical protein